MNAMRFLPAVVTAVLILAPPASARDDGNEARRHGTHVHGEAVLNLVFEGNAVFAELATPAVNVVGFEHSPSTPAQQRRVEEAVSRLRDVRSVFTLDGADCDAGKADIGSPFSGAGEHRTSQHKHQDERHHSEDHHEADRHDHNRHTEFHASYRLDCTRLDKLDALNVTVFEHFPGFSAVRLQWVNAASQGSRKAVPSAPRVRLEMP